jgi:hypothetical protein
LNDQLFEEPGFDTFYKIFLDMAILMPNIPQSIIENKLPVLFRVNGNKAEITQVNGIYLMGLDYFTRVILKDERISLDAIKKFVFFTGHGALIEKLIKENVIQGCENVKLVKKRGQGIYEEINNLL